MKIDVDELKNFINNDLMNRCPDEAEDTLNELLRKIDQMEDLERYKELSKKEIKP